MASAKNMHDFIASAGPVDEVVPLYIDCQWNIAILNQRTAMSAPGKSYLCHLASVN